MLQKRYDKFFENAKVCDHIFMFKNESGLKKDPEFCRDYMPTMLPKTTSEALKVLIAFDHYFFSHQGMSTKRIEKKPKESHCCPFFTCCVTLQRIEHSETCKTKPWRIYEICYPIKEHCWYSLGVMESKATFRKSINSLVFYKYHKLKL